MTFFSNSPAGAAVKFPVPGTKFRGVVSGAVTTAQRVDPRTKQPMAYDDGNPKMQAIIPMTDSKTGADHRLFVPGYSRLQKAINKALGQAGLPDLYQGTELEIHFTHEGKGQGSIPPKEFDVTVLKKGAPVAAVAEPDEDDYEEVPVAAPAAKSTAKQVDPWADGDDDF